MPLRLLQNASESTEYQQAAGGLIKLVTVSPEVPGTIDFIKKVIGSEVVVSLGHSGADYETAMKAIEAGAKSLPTL